MVREQAPVPAIIIPYTTRIIMNTNYPRQIKAAVSSADIVEVTKQTRMLATSHIIAVLMVVHITIATYFQVGDQPRNHHTDHCKQTDSP